MTLGLHRERQTRTADVSLMAMRVCLRPEDPMLTEKVPAVRPVARTRVVSRGLRGHQSRTALTHRDGVRTGLNREQVEHQSLMSCCPIPRAKVPTRPAEAKYLNQRSCYRITHVPAPMNRVPVVPQIQMHLIHRAVVASRGSHLRRNTMNSRWMTFSNLAGADPPALRRHLAMSLILTPISGSSWLTARRATKPARQAPLRWLEGAQKLNLSKAAERRSMRAS